MPPPSSPPLPPTIDKETLDKMDQMVESTQNIADELQRATENIAKSRKETNMWFDAAKAVSAAQANIATAQQQAEAAQKQINANTKQSVDLQRQIDYLGNERANQITNEIASINAQKRAQAAILADTTKSEAEKQAAAQRINELEDRANALQKERRDNRKTIQNNTFLKQILAEQNSELVKQKKLAEGIKSSEEGRLRSANFLAQANAGMLQPLVKDSKEFGKTADLVQGVLAGGATAYFAIIKAALDRFAELDAAALEFRKNTGLLTSQMKDIEKAAREVNTELVKFGVNIGEAYAAASSLVNEFEVVGIVTKESIGETAKLSANLGIATDDTAKFKGMFESIAENAGTTADNSLKAAAAFAKLGGVAVNKVIKDMATASGETLSFLAKTPMALLKASVEARRLGTTVNNLSRAARGLLNYQDSITSELEASALLGKALNFQEARAAAYAGDVVKSRELALQQIEKAGDFTKLNVYQQEALAKAAGMTVEEIIKQQNQQKILAKLEQTRPELYKKYTEMQEKMKENERSATEDLEKQGEIMANQMLMQSRMNALTAMFSEIWISLTNPLVPIAEDLMDIVTDLGNYVVSLAKFIGKLLGPVVWVISSSLKIVWQLIKGIIDPVRDLVDEITKELDFGPVAEYFEQVKSAMTDVVLPAIYTIGTWVGKLIAGVAKAIIWVIKFPFTFQRSIEEAAQFITDVTNWFKEIGPKVWEDIKNIGYEIGRTAIRLAEQSMLALRDFIKDLWNKLPLPEKLKKFIGDLVDFVRSVPDKIKGFFKELPNKIRELFEKLPDKIKDFFRGLPDKIKDFFKGLPDKIKDFFKGLPDKIKDYFKGLPDKINNFFKDLWDKLPEGVKEIPDKIMKYFEDLPEKLKSLIPNWDDLIPGPLKNLFGDNPAKEGEKLGDAMKKGADDGAKAANSLGDAINRSISKGADAAGDGVMKGLKRGFNKFGNWFEDSDYPGKSPSKMGLKIIKGIKSTQSTLFDALAQPFKNVLNFISEIFGGGGDLGDTIIGGIKSMMEGAFDIIVSTFTTAFDIVKKIPLFGKLFGENDAAATINSAIKSDVESQVGMAVEVKNINELKETVNKLTEAIVSLGGVAGGASQVVSVNNDQKATLEKLDELIGLLKDGAIAINMDGVLVSKTLAKAS